MRVTQIDIAKKVKLDVSTVSKILNEVVGPKFRASTRRRVFATAKRLGWKPQKTDARMAKLILRNVRDVFKKVGTAGEKLSKIWLLLGKVS